MAFKSLMHRSVHAVLSFYVMIIAWQWGSIIIVWHRGQPAVFALSLQAAGQHLLLPQVLAHPHTSCNPPMPTPHTHTARPHPNIQNHPQTHASAHNTLTHTHKPNTL